MSQRNISDEVALLTISNEVSPLPNISDEVAQRNICVITVTYLPIPCMHKRFQHWESDEPT